MLITSIKYLFPGISFETECVMENAGSGPYIARWNRTEPQPTQADIEAAYPAALTAAGVVDTERVQWQADRADLKSKYDAAITRLEAIRDAVSPTNAQVVAALRDVARYQIHILKYIRGL